MLLCPVFSINVSAADEDNLIDSDLSNWTILHPEKCSVFPASSSLYLVRIYGVEMPPVIEDGPSPIWYIGGAFDLTDTSITVGNKYTLSFNFPDPDRYVSSSTGSNSFLGDNSGILVVGLCSYISDDSVEAVEGCYLTIDKNNFNSVKDTDIQLSFEMPSGVVNPCICFYYVNFDGTNAVCFYLKDFKLVDESEAEEDGFIDKLINGIKGLFVPDDAFISQWKSDMEQTLSEHLGFIYQIPALTIDYVERLQVLFNDKSIYFSIPACQFELNGEFINLWPETSVDLTFLTNAENGTIWHTIYKQMYPVFLRLVLFGILIKYGRNEWDKVMMN